MGKDKITNETEVSTTELACVLGITGRRIRQLAEDGQLEKTGQGSFLLCDSVQKYLLMASSSRSVPTKEEKDKLDAEISIKKAKAVKAVLEANELKGKMHRSEDVADMTEDLIYTIRSSLISLPGRLAVDCAASDNAAEIANIIRKEVYGVMEELSRYRYDPKKYAERVRERNSWDSDGDDDESE